MDDVFELVGQSTIDAAVRVRGNEIPGKVQGRDWTLSSLTMKMQSQ
jgi:hypothetical protein